MCAKIINYKENIPEQNINSFVIRKTQSCALYICLYKPNSQIRIIGKICITYVLRIFIGSTLYLYSFKFVYRELTHTPGNQSSLVNKI